MAQSRDRGVIQVRVDVDATHADDPITSPGEVQAFTGIVEAVGSRLPLGAVSNGDHVGPLPLVGDGHEYITMAGLIDRAIAGEVSVSEFALDVLDSDPQPASEQVFTEPADGFPPAEIQRVRIAPLVGRLKTETDIARCEVASDIRAS